jgi:hypothetical protein
MRASAAPTVVGNEPLIAPRNMHLKIFSLLFALLSALLSATGRGFVGLVHGIMGSVLGLECFYAVSRFDSKSTLRVRFRFVCAFIACLSIHIDSFWYGKVA